MPDMDQLFRRLPKSLPTRILEAAKREGVTFTFATEGETDALKRTLRNLFEEKAYLQKLNRERKTVNTTAGHRSLKAQQLQAEIVNARYRLEITEKRLAGALSPVADIPVNSMQLFGATPARPGITLVFPPANQQAISGLMKNFRNGVRAAPTKNLMGDGAALLLFVVQVVNLWEVAADALTKKQQSRLPFVSAVMATGAAGFAAAQGVFDTALTARSSMLAKGLQNHAVAHVQVQMGKLHIGLGMATYFFGIFSAGASIPSYRGNWELAVRSGNDSAQKGAIVSMAGSGGLLASNLYGLGNTGYAGYTVLVAKQGAARTAAWAASGARLSSVFFRANLAGAFFTVLELGGSYYYNKYNTNAHDQWLQATPWGQDSNKRQALSLAQYQHALVALMQAPSVQVGRVEEDVWWKNLLLGAKVGDIHLLLPGLDTAAFLAPMGGRPSHQLYLGAYRITTARTDRARTTERWEILSESVEARLRRVEGDQMILCVDYPPPHEWMVGTSEELMLVVAIQSTDASGRPQQRTYCIRLDPNGSGAFPSVDQVPPPPHAPLLEVEPLLLELVSHV
jgi:hypothetical protein